MFPATFPLTIDMGNNTWAYSLYLIFLVVASKGHVLLEFELLRTHFSLGEE